jgi:hypothetical protein
MARRNPLLMVLVGGLGIVAIVLGIRQMVSGVREMSSGSGQSELIAQADEQVTTANRLTNEAAPVFLAALSDLETRGLDFVRQEHAAALPPARDQFNQAAENLDQAADKLESVSRDVSDGKQREYYATKSRAYRQFATTKRVGVQIIDLMLDPSKTDQQALLAEIVPLTDQIDSANTQGKELESQAERMAGPGQENDSGQ